MSLESSITVSLSVDATNNVWLIRCRTITENGDVVANSIHRQQIYTKGQEFGVDGFTLESGTPVSSPLSVLASDKWATLQAAMSALPDKLTDAIVP